MIKNAVIWRKTFGIEALLEEDLWVPRDGESGKVHAWPWTKRAILFVIGNVYGEFQDKDLYAKASSVMKVKRRGRSSSGWRIQFLEKGIRQQLDFSPSWSLYSWVQVFTDLKNSPGPGKR
ncbi:hypothetical protein J5N97_000436 [Dioscorea zingiberensis]|uniref:Uncharacterized protein n=1 Tax=Dioscorea zingiberensis TaxID=325984 RepID=A0A9D5BVN8_9LILI|nr:hypothetical protein J5N97_000436 [Dioscorea zingiberensis]